jgi:hypothetical protein
MPRPTRYAHQQQPQVRELIVRGAWRGDRRAQPQRATNTVQPLPMDVSGSIYLVAGTPSTS